jgi:hypothetical protein
MKNEATRSNEPAGAAHRKGDRRHAGRAEQRFCNDVK